MRSWGNQQQGERREHLPICTVGLQAATTGILGNRAAWCIPLLAAGFLQGTAHSAACQPLPGLVRPRGWGAGSRRAGSVLRCVVGWRRG